MLQFLDQNSMPVMMVLGYCWNLWSLACRYNSTPEMPEDTSLNQDTSIKFPVFLNVGCNIEIGPGNEAGYLFNTEFMLEK